MQGVTYKPRASILLGQICISETCTYRHSSHLPKFNHYHSRSKSNGTSLYDWGICPSFTILILFSIRNALIVLQAGIITSAPFLLPEHIARDRMDIFMAGLRISVHISASEAARRESVNKRVHLRSRSSIK